MRQSALRIVCGVLLVVSAVAVALAGPLTSRPAVSLVGGEPSGSRALAAFALSR